MSTSSFNKVLVNRLLALVTPQGVRPEAFALKAVAPGFAVRQWPPLRNKRTPSQTPPEDIDNGWVTTELRRGWQH